MNTKVYQFLEKASKWKEELILLRKIILANKELVEEYKWMHPCYTYQGKNVVLIHGFKEYCALLFFKGALLKDTAKMLVQQTENVQSARQIRFTSVAEVKKHKSNISNFIKEAIEIERSGKKIILKDTSEYEVPEELKKEFKKNAKLKTAFKALTPGRQRGYLFYFAKAKRSETRQSRIKKSIPNILKGKGFDDK